VRQLEGSYLSNSLAERSKERLQRLPYIEKVEFESKPVPGTPDLVDVDYTIKDGLPGQFSGGIGYSASQGAILNGSFVHSNFMGSGQRVALELQGGQYAKVYSFSHTDPYTNIDGVSRSIGMQHRDVTQFVSARRLRDEERLGVVEYGYPSASTRCASGVLQTSDLIVTSLYAPARRRLGEAIELAERRAATVRRRGNQLAPAYWSGTKFRRSSWRGLGHTRATAHLRRPRHASRSACRSRSSDVGATRPTTNFEAGSAGDVDLFNHGRGRL
jgi:hypothetical protein